MKNKDSLLGELIGEMKLPYLRFSVTKDCNGNCPFCHNEGQGIGLRGNNAKKHESHLSIKEIKGIASYFKKYFKKVKFTGGEPLLVDNFPEIVKIFCNKGYSCTLTTNAFLFNEKKQEELKEAGITKVNISIPSLNEKRFDKSFGVNGYLKTVLKNLKTVSKYFKKVRINFIANSENLYSELLEFDNLSKKYGIPISTIELISPTTLKRPLSLEIINFLKEKKGIEKIKSIKNRFGSKKIYTFKGGGMWEIDDFREKNYRKEAFDNKVCKDCVLKKVCTECPYALRLSYDGVLRPCLARCDNLIKIDELNIYKEPIN